MRWITFWAHLTSWPEHTWILYPYYHIPSLLPKGLQLFKMRTTFTFSAYLTIWHQMTFDLWTLTCELRSHQLTNEGSHAASMIQWPSTFDGWNPWKHVKLESNVNPFSWQTTTTVDKVIPLSFLLRQATQKAGTWTPCTPAVINVFRFSKRLINFATSATIFYMQQVAWNW